MLPVPAAAMIRRMWAVTTQGDLPDEHESHHHHESVPAWDDYHGRILELEAHGYTQKWEGAAEYGKRWLCELSRSCARAATKSGDGASRRPIREGFDIGWFAALE